MLTNVAVHIPGEPQGKGRARVGKIAGHVRMFTPAKTVAYEGLIAHAAAQVMQGSPPWTSPVALHVDIVHGVPPSWSRRKRESALRGELVPTRIPDADNVIKAIGDGCNGVIWRDDRQIVRLSVVRRFGERPGVWFTACIVSAVEGA